MLDYQKFNQKEDRVRGLGALLIIVFSFGAIGAGNYDEYVSSSYYNAVGEYAPGKRILVEWGVYEYESGKKMTSEVSVYADCMTPLEVISAYDIEIGSDSNKSGIFFEGEAEKYQSVSNNERAMYFVLCGAISGAKSMTEMEVGKNYTFESYCTPAPRKSPKPRLFDRKAIPLGKYNLTVSKADGLYRGDNLKKDCN